MRSIIAINNERSTLTFNSDPFSRINLVIGILVLAAGYISKKETIKSTALGIFIFAALATLIAFYSGEEAEEIIEETTNISHKLIHEHEENTETLYLMNIILALLAIVTLWLQSRKTSFVKNLYVNVPLLAIATSVIGVLSGNSGGLIRYTEISK